MAHKFVCDGMLGRLSKLLRMLGIDAAYTNQGMAILLRARHEARTILTRNTRLKDRPGVFFIEPAAVGSQLRALIEEFDLWSDIRPFTRCVECNERLVAVEKPAVKDRVPHYTYMHYDEYAQCPGCGRIYWKGSHYQRMRQTVETVLGRKTDGAWDASSGRC